MTDRAIDEILNQAVDGAGGEALAQIRIALPLRAVRPLAPRWVWVGALLLVFAVVAVGGAASVGMYGLRALSGVQLTIVFAVVAAAASIAAVAAMREMIPASGRRIAGVALLGAVVGLLVTFGLIFHDYGTQKFVPQGVACLRGGLMFAIPAALVLCLLARRGFVLSLTAAGLTAGTLAGLAGIGVLEIHCPILNASHAMVWHVGVVVLSGVVGWGIGALLANRRYVQM
jgi:hypothetical protein